MATVSADLVYLDFSERMTIAILGEPPKYLWLVERFVALTCEAGAGRVLAIDMLQAEFPGIAVEQEILMALRYMVAAIGMARDIERHAEMPVKGDQYRALRYRVLVGEREGKG